MLLVWQLKSMAASYPVGYTCDIFHWLEHWDQTWWYLSEGIDESIYFLFYDFNHNRTRPIETYSRQIKRDLPH